MKIRIISALLTGTLLLSTVGNAFAQAPGTTPNNPIIAMSADPAQIAIDVRASLAFFNRTDDLYWVSLCNHVSNGYSDGVWRLGWNRYFEDRANPANTGSADPRDGNLPALHTAAPPIPPVLQPPPVVPISPLPPTIIAPDLSVITDQNERIFTNLTAQILDLKTSLTTRIDAIDTKFTAYEQNPPWLQKILSNHYVQLALTGVATFITCKTTGKC